MIYFGAVALMRNLMRQLFLIVEICQTIFLLNEYPNATDHELTKLLLE